MNRTKSLAIVNLIIFIGTLIVNYLANAIPINGLTTGEISALYPNLFVPAGITFAIWGLIYTLMGIFTVYQLIIAFQSNSKHNIVRTIGIWNIILGIGNMLWILAWHYLKVSLSLVIMLSMLLSLIIIYKRLGIEKGLSPKKEIWLVHINFSIYLGWISIATIANITVFLVNINWSGLGISDVSWTIIIMTVGVALALTFIYKYGDLFYALVVIWALIGIYIQRTTPGIEPIRAIILWSIIGITIISIAIISSILQENVYAFRKLKRKISV